MKVYDSKTWSFGQKTPVLTKEARSFLFWSWEVEVLRYIPKYMTKEVLMEEVNKFIVENNINVVTMTDTAKFVTYTIMDYGCDDYNVTERVGEVCITYWREVKA